MVPGACTIGAKHEARVGLRGVKGAGEWEWQDVSEKALKQRCERGSFSKEPVK